MLCTVALRRMRAEDGAGHYSLRITGKTSQGPSRTGGRDTKDGLSASAVRAILQSLGLNEDVLTAADAVINDPESSDRFTTIAESVQIPFELLERADIYLFD